MGVICGARTCWLVVASVACSTLSPSAVVRAPIQQTCEQAKLKACAALASGVTLYIDGDESTADTRLRAVVAANGPEGTKRLAELIVKASNVPGAAAAAGPVSEVASRLLVMADSADQGSPRRSAQPVAVANGSPTTRATAKGSETRSTQRRRHALDQATTRAIAAPVDPNRLITSSAVVGADPYRFGCMLAGAEASCSVIADGPVIVTDYVALDGCPDSLYLGTISTATSVQIDARAELNWVVPVTTRGTHGARLWVNGGEKLYLASDRPADAAGDTRRCVVTWAAFRPRLVPTRATPDLDE